MRLKRLAPLILALTAVIVVVSAQPPFTSEDDVRSVLEKAVLVETWCNHYHIVYDNRTIGVLWQNVSLKDVQIGKPLAFRWGYRYPLFYNGQYVGFVVNYEATPNFWCGCRCCWRFT
jgi:hypothetical protein